MESDTFDDPLANAADQAVRSALAETLLAAMVDCRPGEDTGDRINSVFVGALAGVTRFVHQFQAAGQTHETIADAMRDVIFSFLAQADANERAGRA